MMTTQPVPLKFLLRQRHWQTYRTFCQEYDNAAKSVDPRLVGTWPSRAQLHRWISGELKGLPYGDHCRILERMFPGWSAEQLFGIGPIEIQDLGAVTIQPDAREPHRDSADRGLQLVTSAAELTEALIDVVLGAHECLVTVGSRSREPLYLQEIERALAVKPNLNHYRILIGPPHSQILKDHLLRLIELRNPHANSRKTLHVGLLNNLTRDYERFFAASEQSAVVMLPSVNSPVNFDTGLVIRDPLHSQGLLQHGIALYGRHKLETVEAINELEVLE
jgi:hypothetical protein